MFEAIMNRAHELGGREISPDPATLAFEFDDPDAGWCPNLKFSGRADEIGM